MILLHNVCRFKYERTDSNYNTVEEVLAATEPISFDGVYLNVWYLRKELAPKLKGAILFYMGKYVGKDNKFDEGASKFERYCDWNQLHDLVDNYGCVWGYHSYTHINLTHLKGGALMREVRPLFPVEYFAYPYGNVNDEVVEAVKECGYKEAYSVSQGDDSQFQRKRHYLNW